MSADEGEQGAITITPNAADDGDIEMTAYPVSIRVHSTQNRMVPP
jgi:hypothetical protein